MISFLSKNIAHFLYNQKILEDKKIEVCQYGFEIIIGIMVGFLLIVISGFIFNDVLSAILFYVIFVVVRYYTGGFHASTHFKCKTTLLISYLFVLFGTKAFINNASFIIHCCLLFFYLITVILFSPIENVNAKLSSDIRQKNRNISIIMAVILTIGNMFGFWYFLRLSTVSTLTLFVIAALIIYPKIKERRTSNNEEAY